MIGTGPCARDTKFIASRPLPLIVWLTTNKNILYIYLSTDYRDMDHPTQDRSQRSKKASETCVNCVLPIQD